MLCKKEAKSRISSESNGSPVQLKKSIGIWKGVSIIVGSIVGSGIFTSPIGVLKHSNSVGMSFLMWSLCGMFSLLGAIVYAELGVTIPHSGGEYIYILHSFGPLCAFTCMWISFVTIGSVSLAANGLIFAQYILQSFFPDCKIQPMVIVILTIFGILTLTAVNCYNVNWATQVTVVFTVCKVSALLIIISIGCYNIYQGKTESFSDPFEGSNVSYGGLSLAFYQGFWAFAGWNYLNFLTDEMKNPSRTLPIAIIISMILVTTIYLAANFAYLAVLSPREMLDIGKSSVAVAVVFANKTMGKFAWMMPIFVAASVFGSMNGEFLSGSRLTYAAAKEGHFPQAFAMVSYKFLTPMPAVILLSILSLGFLAAPNIDYLIELAGFAFCITAGMAVACLIYLRIKFPELPRSFKLPLVLPILFLVVDVFISCLTVYQAPLTAFISLAIMASGIPLYFIGVVWKSKPKSFLDITELLTIFVQQLMLVIPEDDALNQK